LDRHTLPFLPNFQWAFVRIDSGIYWPNLMSVALPIPEVIAIEVLGGVANLNLGEEAAVGGRGLYRSKERL